MSNELTLGGLIGTEPLGFLAAMGALRALDGCCPGRFRLTFEAEGFAARLVSTVPVSRDEVIDLLVTRQPGRIGAPELSFGEDDLKVEPSRWAELLREHRGTESEAFFAAYASELVLLGNGTGVKPTALHMTAGQQRLIRDLAKLADTLGAPPQTKRRRGQPETGVAESYQEALFGPWRYADDQHPFGWDPSAERLYAYRAVSPSSDRQGRSARAAVWLAYEAIPGFPVFARSNRFGAFLATTGFHRMSEETVMIWPVWTVPVTALVVRWLLADPELRRTEDDDLARSSAARRSLAARGVVAVCRSVRADLGDKGYAILRPPEIRPMAHE